MCFLNPKYKRTFILEVCTAHGTLDEFNKNVNEKIEELVKLEMRLNKDASLRWKIEEDLVD